MKQSIKSKGLCLIPSFAPTAALIKLLQNNISYEVAVNLIIAAYYTLTRQIGRKVNLLLISLTDLTSGIKAFRDLSLDVLELAKLTKTPIIIDSGGFELYNVHKTLYRKFGINYSILNNPILNIKTQIKYAPNIMVLPDKPRNPTENVKILNKNNLEEILKHANDLNIDVLFVLHGLNRFNLFWSYAKKTKLIHLVSYIGVTDLELRIFSSPQKILSLLANTGKKIAIMGIDKITLDRLKTLASYNVVWTDCIKWMYRKFEEKNNSLYTTNIRYLQLNEELVKVLSNNLSIMKKLTKEVYCYGRKYTSRVT